MSSPRRRLHLDTYIAAHPDGPFGILIPPYHLAMESKEQPPGEEENAKIRAPPGRAGVSWDLCLATQSDEPKMGLSVLPFMLKYKQVKPNLDKPDYNRPCETLRFCPSQRKDICLIAPADRAEVAYSTCQHGLTNTVKRLTRTSNTSLCHD